MDSPVALIGLFGRVAQGEHQMRDDADDAHQDRDADQESESPSGCRCSTPELDCVGTVDHDNRQDLRQDAFFAKRHELSPSRRVDGMSNILYFMSFEHDMTRMSNNFDIMAVGR